MLLHLGNVHVTVTYIINNNIIPRAGIGYEMINEECYAELAIIISYPTSVSGIIIVLLKTIKTYFLDLADSTL